MHDDQPELDEQQLSPEVSQSVSRGPQGIDLPPQVEVLREARTLVANRDVRINQLATLISLDPITTLELLKVANATYFSADRPPITNVRTAVVRLGSGAIIETLDQLAKRPPLAPHAVALQFEVLRTLSTQVSGVSQMIASVACRDLVEVAQTAGLVSYMGHMVACAYLGERYTEMSNARHYASLAFKLAQDYNFDVRAVQIAYLRMRGIPNDIFFALDRDMQCKTSAQANLRFSVQGATELVEALHGGKWEKYSPYQPLPAKSALRLLKISEHQYVDLYEAIGEYLRRPVMPTSDSIADASEKPAEESDSPSPEPAIEINEPSPPLDATQSHMHEVLNQEANYLTQTNDQVTDDAEQLSEGGKKILMLIQQMCMDCRTVQELLSSVLTLLITDGPYARAALLLLGNERQSATIHTAVGDGFDGAAQIVVEDPLSPLALCLTKINSFNAQGLEDTLSPFGITSYAVSPINLKAATAPVVLYADCGIDRSLPMEARKIFRLVVGLLNHILPELPGGLPKRGNKPPPRGDLDRESSGSDASR